MVLYWNNVFLANSSAQIAYRKVYLNKIYLHRILRYTAFCCAMQCGLVTFNVGKISILIRLDFKFLIFLPRYFLYLFSLIWAQEFSTSFHMVNESNSLIHIIFKRAFPCKNKAIYHVFFRYNFCNQRATIILFNNYNNG